MKSFIRGLYEDKFKRYLILSLFILGIILLIQGSSSVISESESEVHFFHHPNCHFCQMQKPFNEGLMEKYPNVEWIYHDISSADEAAFFRDMAVRKGLGLEKLFTPTTFIGDNYFVGYNDKIGAQIESAIANYGKGNESSFDVSDDDFNPLVSVPFFGEINVLEFSLPTLAVVLGFVDGFNPCAMWVLVYLISLIAGLNDKRKIWLLVGSFVFASGMLYFLFMTAWLNVFLFIGYLKPLTMAIGLFALGVGIYDLKVYVSTRGALACPIGDADSKKKTMSRMQRVVMSPLTWGSILGIIGLAFVVNSIEFACSAAIPAIYTQVLSISNLSGLQYYLYILLYDVFFMLDDLIIFGLAAFAINTTVGDRYAKYCKLIGGVILIVLGLLLSFAPEVLR